jgi:hypothetical protein
MYIGTLIAIFIRLFTTADMRVDHLTRSLQVKTNQRLGHRTCTIIPACTFMDYIVVHSCHSFIPFGGMQTDLSATV